jgi:hypothetical protein
MTKPLSPAAEAVFTAILNLKDNVNPRHRIAAAALQAAADHIDHDWSAFNCVDALYEIAAELDNSAQQ